ncbi:hypothetical protein AB0I60_29415 [Actinosynnema sp. NPDC050436]|uniref:hypothetical protein n=1 Tax=Actinosynnema sp. NPDC050436 TaxID=3155659 RepID=UPI0033D7A8D3
MRGGGVVGRVSGLVVVLVVLLASATGAAPRDRPRSTAEALTTARPTTGPPAADPSAADPSATDPFGVPADRPLPGHSISNPVLPPALVGGAPTRVLQGVHEHAGYAIEVPPRWNRRLLVWAHGYRGTGKVLEVEPPAFGLRQRLLDGGFAWASSSYYANGYDVKAGVESTHDLALRFADLVGEPQDVFVAGASMGGHVVVRSLEQHPGFYRAALPVCGVLGDQELFDYLLDYQLAAQALAGVDAHPLPRDYLAVAVPKIKQALGLYGTPNDLGAQLAEFVVDRSGGERPGARAAFEHWKEYLFSLAGTGPAGTASARGLAADPNQVATNLDTRYRPNTPVDLDRVVERVPPANPAARAAPELTEVARVDGRPSAPVLSLHGLGDLFVPFSMEQVYARDVRSHGLSHLLAQRAVRAVEHCEFSPAEVGRAWDDLVRWADTGARPEADVVDDPAVVAAPGYGCRFTDPTAREPATRRVFPTC